MGKTGRSDREHSVHYLFSVAVVTVIVAGMAWFGQNRTLALAAAALGLYALHLLSIRSLLENQRRQRQVLDAQWEVLQRFLGDGPARGPVGATSDEPASELELVPPMPVDREDPETLEPRASGRAHTATLDRSDLVPPVESMSDRGAEEPMEPHLEAPEEQAVDPEPAARRTARDVGRPTEPESEGRAAQADAAPSPATSAAPRTGHPAGAARRNGTGEHEVPVPRHFALGTVALVRNLLTPEEVARVLLEQRRQPGKKFGILAVEMDLLTETQREALLLAQQEGLFTDAEMREARQRLREFRESAAHSLAGLE